jgi:hypothetical protein
MSIINRLFKDETDNSKLDTKTNKNERRKIFFKHIYLCEQFTNVSCMKDLFGAMWYIKRYESDNYKVSHQYTTTDQKKVWATYYVTLEALKENITIEIVRTMNISEYTFKYVVRYVTFKDEVIYNSSSEWLCDGPIKQGVYDILDKVTLLVKEELENREALMITWYDQQKLEQQERCKRINEEFMQLKNGV